MQFRAAVVAAAALAATGAAPEPRTILVSAAASLTDVLAPLVQMYEQRAGVKADLNLGASNTLARQIASGAKVDVFISADEAQMDAVATEIVSGTRVDLLSNQLVVVVPGDRPRTLRSIRDLTDPQIRRIAIGDPAAVPAGVYARTYLEHVNVWTDLASRIVPCGSVRLALAAVANGAADAGIVYKTDAATTTRVRIAFLVERSDAPRIVYPAAVIRGSAHEADARAFLDFLRSPDAMRVFEQAGFIRP